MQKLLFAAGLLLASAMPCAAHDWNVVELADGVVAFLQPSEGRFNDSNSVVIDGDPQGLLVVDTQEDPEATRALLAEAAARFDKPVRWLVNTHWHTDHIGGNSVVRDAFPDVTILGHAALFEDIPGQAQRRMEERVVQIEGVLPAAEEQLQTRRKRDGTTMTDDELAAQTERVQAAKDWVASHRGMVYLAPSLGFDQPIRLHLGDREVHLLPYRGHTGGDTVLHLPAERLLITGDLLDDLPFVGHGHPREWIQALDALDGLDFDRIVPGHGPVFEGNDQLQTLRGFLADLVAQVDTALAEGKTLEETVEAIDLSTWREKLARDAAGERFFDGVRADAIQRAYEEAGE